jgi:heptosyltransferase-2
VLRDVRRAHYDCVLACRNHVSINYVLTAVAAGARHTVGFDEAPGGFLFTRRLHVTAGVSVLRTNLALAAAIDADPETGREEFWFGEEDSAAVAALLGRRGIPADAPIAVIHPASNWQSKTWYPDRWAAVADWLATEGGLRPVFVGRSRDAEVIRAVQESMRADSYSVAGETDLCQLGALMARADLFVGTDSGPRHIAGALGRPQVTVMSSLDEPWRWGLDRPGEILLRTDPPCHGCMLSSCSHRLCLDLISADRVIAACRELLGRTRPAAVPRLTMSV